MFTGIIEEVGIVDQIRYGTQSAEIKINAYTVLDGTKPGDSIAVNGACLTVTECGMDFFVATAMEVTWGLTNLHRLTIGSSVNLERALTPTGRFGGHFVTGHIDCRGVIISKIKTEISTEAEISFPSEYSQYLVPRGSIAVDGMSLTISQLNGTSFCVSIIPHTERHTIISKKKIGDEVNLEFDVLGKYICRQIQLKTSTKIDKNFLEENGFFK